MKKTEAFMLNINDAFMPTEGQMESDPLYREKWREDSNIPKHVVLQV